MSAKDCVPVLRAAGLDGMASWAEARPVRLGGRGRTCRDLWASAPQGDWLLWYAQKAGAPRPALVRAAAACVRPALRFVREGEDRPRLAVEAADAWADDPTEGTMRRAQEAADAAWEAGRTELAALAAANAAAAAGSMKAAAEWAAKAGRAGEMAKIVAKWRWAGNAAVRAAGARRYAEGQESESAAHAACAEDVRRLVPFRDLAGR